MNEQTQTYKARLEKMLVEVTAELQSVGIHDQKNPSDWLAIPRDLDAEEPDLNVAADNVESWNERNALVSALEPRYNNIVRALKKIEEGTFGTCEVCGKDIETQRLDADPAARTCILHVEEHV